MSARAIRLTPALLSLFFSGIFSAAFCDNGNGQPLILYTPYTEIFVPPGESVNYPLDVINKSSSEEMTNITISGLPRGWTWELKSGNLTVGQVAVLPGEKKSISLQVQVPLRVNKGNYHFRVLAGGLASLPLTVAVSEQGIYKTEFSTEQPNMEGAANTTFTFGAKLKNSFGEKQLYSFRSIAPPGWNVAFKANYKQVASVEVEANHTQDVSIVIDPPDETGAGTYRIPVVASTGASSASMNLEVHITGSYSVELSTPNGLLSTSITAGDSKRIEFVVNNTGSAELDDIDLRSVAPINWTVSFDPKKIPKLAPGETAQVFADIKADKNAIAGDYITNLEARSPAAISKAAFRVSVKTPVLWSWSGLMIIFASCGSVYYLFRKYGRR
jgi:uncharacterized membrane protein